MIGQSTRQSFTTGDETVFLYWEHRIPTVVDASSLKAGDRIIVRIRAAGGSSLGEVEATAAKRVADREPKAQEVEPERQGVTNEPREDRVPQLRRGALSPFRLSR